MTNTASSITKAIAWCLAWGDQRQPQFSLDVLHQMLQALEEQTELPEETRSLVQQVQQLQSIPADYFPEKITQIQEDYPSLWEQPTRIGLVYGGATKIKGYVFEAAKLQDIRGASAILDRINLVDLPAFFDKKYSSISKWLNKHFPGLEAALIPELIIYSTGGNILAFCPAAYVHDLANAIERRYTEETLTANSCAVGDTFRLLEFRFGLLRETIAETKWLDWYLNEQTRSHPLVQAYFGRPESGEDWVELFKNRKSFNELAGRLAGKFNQRRSGNDLPDVQRPSRRYPPMFETHPYLVRDEGDRRSAVARIDSLPGEPWFSDTLARKHIVGQSTKRENAKAQRWYYKNSKFHWQVGNLGRRWGVGQNVSSWVRRFDNFLQSSEYSRRYYGNINPREVQESRNLAEIGNSSQGFVAYIYADGNNMGGYIQKIRTPEEYKEFSDDISQATVESVYIALAKHLHPRTVQNLAVEPESKDRNGLIVHPFEIITIGGDDVLLIVPADKALDIAKTIGEEFERILLEGEEIKAKQNYKISSQEIIFKSVKVHRYQSQTAIPSQCKLSMSIGVLITADSTPIYYAQQLTEQLLKSAKVRAKELKNQNYYGGTVDFLVMKSVTMISSSISSFRQEGLTKSVRDNQTLKLYVAPYTLHELGGLLLTGKALKESGFPRSQLYQIRSLLEQGKHTAILNYRYFRVRLQADKQKLLETNFEQAWCEAKTNNGNVAPWMYIEPDKEPDQQQSPEKAIYETIWRELVDLYPFIEASETVAATTENSTMTK
ncbi:MAG TPA: type III-B CRISPR-associated protein Cas10/Cmr2 [Candidatus Obscuribacterales bacterium]